VTTPPTDTDAEAVTDAMPRLLCAPSAPARYVRPR
jgi:hypothetical protein